MVIVGYVSNRFVLIVLESENTDYNPEFLFLGRITYSNTTLRTPIILLPIVG